MAVLIVCTLGCGSVHEASVSGVVTLDGETVTKGVVSFHPQNGGSIALAPLDEHGHYELRTGTEHGLPPGGYTITVTSVERPPEPGMSPQQIEALRITPKHYGDPATSGLTYNVEPGGNTYDIMLTRSAP